MSKQLSDNQRMTRAVCETSNLHDRAYACEMSMQMIAERWMVPLEELKKRTRVEVTYRKERELELARHELLNAGEFDE